MAEWMARPLEQVYCAVFIDAIYVKVRDDQVANRPFYAAIGVDLAGHKDVPDCGPAPRWRVGEVLAAGTYRAAQPRDAAPAGAPR